jgi:hypothetical protein
MRKITLVLTRVFWPPLWKGAKIISRTIFVAGVG